MPRITCGALQIGRRRIVAGPAEPKRILTGDVSDLLLLTGGILTRKLAITWHKNAPRNGGYSELRFSRGVPSGGGLYPYCIYLISLTPRVLQPAVYHYDTAHHGLHRIRVGQYSSFLETILNCEVRNHFDVFFVVVCRFWRSAFKYGRFSYKVIMQDMGAVIGGMEQIAFSLSWGTTVFHYFVDRLMGQLLGLDERVEAPFVVVGVRCDARAMTWGRTNSETCVTELPTTAFQHRERSPASAPLDYIRDIHKSTLLDRAHRPPQIAMHSPPSMLSEKLKPIVGRDLVAALLKRETTWGQITSGGPELDREILMALMVFAWSGSGYVADLYDAAGRLPLLRVEVFVRNVTGLAAGLYRYDGETAELVDNRGCSHEHILRHSFAVHQNVDQVPVVVYLVGKFREVLDSLGQRGMRVMNAEAGIFTERTYLACAALSLGCGAVLGFDAGGIGTALNLDVKAEIPLLAILIGPRRPKAIAFDFQLLPLASI